jgi:hypothetical protein
METDGMLEGALLIDGVSDGRFEMLGSCVTVSWVLGALLGLMDTVGSAEAVAVGLSVGTAVEEYSDGTLEVSMLNVS